MSVLLKFKSHKRNTQNSTGADCCCMYTCAHAQTQLQHWKQTTTTTTN